MEPELSPRRHSRVTHSWLALVAALTLCTSACSPSDAPEASPVTTPESAKSEAATPIQLDCPGDETVQTDGGLRSPGALMIGHASPMIAVQAWMESQGGDDFVLDSAESTAWVLRDDGTAQARLNVVQVTYGEGWVVQGFEACTAEDRTAAAIAMPLGHCWIDPVRFDGAEWAVVPADQFGSGGGMPKKWAGVGTLTRRSETRTSYQDAGGTALRLVPADRPAAAATFEQGCD